MAKASQSLEKLRKQIDQVDDAIHDLLMQRTALAQKVRGLKGDGATDYFRPGREALILRRLIQRHHGAFHKPALVRIWREIMGAVLRLEGPFSVAVYNPENMRGYWDLARDQYGTYTPIAGYTSPGQVIRAVREETATVGVLPLPQEDDADPWWPYLVSDDVNTPVITARLPIAGAAAGQGDGLDALAIARVAQERTGDDRSIWVVETPERISRASVLERLGAVGLDAAFLGAWRGDQETGRWWHLVEIADYVAADDPRIARLVEQAGGAVNRVLPLGGYAVPFSPAELNGPGGN